MKAKVRADACGDITVYLEGALNHENCLPLQTKLEILIVKNPNCNIMLDMYKLDFVGSSGISLLVDTIKNLTKQTPRFKVSNVKSEFVKVFKLYNLDLSNSTAENRSGEADPAIDVPKWHKGI